jgi:hypothetical protein
VSFLSMIRSSRIRKWARPSNERPSCDRSPDQNRRITRFRVPWNPSRGLGSLRSLQLQHENVNKHRLHPHMQPHRALPSHGRRDSTSIFTTAPLYALEDGPDVDVLSTCQDFLARTVTGNIAAHLFVSGACLLSSMNTQQHDNATDRTMNLICSSMHHEQQQTPAVLAADAPGA